MIACCGCPPLCLVRVPTLRCCCGGRKEEEMETACAWLPGVCREMPPGKQVVLMLSCESESRHFSSIFDRHNHYPHHHYPHRTLSSKRTKPGSQSCGAWRLLLIHPSPRALDNPSPAHGSSDLSPQSPQLPLYPHPTRTAPTRSPSLSLPLFHLDRSWHVGHL